MGAGPRPLEVPLSDVIGALSYALDLTEGEPPGHAVRTCMIGMRLALEIGMGEEERSDLFYALLLKDAGCSANSARMAALFAVDDRVAKRSSKRIDWARSFTAFMWTLRTVAPGGSVRTRASQLLSMRQETEITRSLMRARCERGAEIARLLGLGAGTAAAIRALDEHWDGHGQPEGLRGDEIPLGGRILCLAQTVEIFHAARGIDAALRVASRRSGGWFDPRLVDALKRTRSDVAFWGSLPAAELRPWEPRERRLTADEAYMDRIADAFAGVVDAKSPWTYRHSDRTCVIAMSIAALLGCEDRGARRHAPRGAAARHRQARDLQPDPRQARAADRGRVRARTPPSAAHGLDPRAHAGLRGAGTGGRARTTSGSTARATRTGSTPAR